MTLDKIPSDLLDLVDGSIFIPFASREQMIRDNFEAVEAQFGSYLHEVKWLNMGGGHHITREGYDVDC